MCEERVEGPKAPMPSDRRNEPVPTPGAAPDPSRTWDPPASVRLHTRRRSVLRLFSAGDLPRYVENTVDACRKALDRISSLLEQDR